MKIIYSLAVWTALQNTKLFSKVHNILSFHGKLMQWGHLKKASMSIWNEFPMLWAAAEMLKTHQIVIQLTAQETSQNIYHIFLVFWKDTLCFCFKRVRERVIENFPSHCYIKYTTPLVCQITSPRCRVIMSGCHFFYLMRPSKWKSFLISLATLPKSYKIRGRRFVKQQSIALSLHIPPCCSQKWCLHQRHSVAVLSVKNLTSKSLLNVSWFLYFI